MKFQNVQLDTTNYSIFIIFSARRATKYSRDKPVQIPPLTFSDLSLLLAVGAIILLITAELASPYYGLTNLTINKKKLRTAALTTGILFLITVAIRIIGMIA